MKDLVRQKIGIHVEIMDLLNEQIKKEAHSSSIYLAMASWCDHNALDNSAAFFYEQAEEEREHMMKIFKFINDNGGTAYSPEVTGINHDFNSLEEILKQLWTRKYRSPNQFTILYSDVEKFRTLPLNCSCNGSSMNKWKKSKQLEEH